jgi:hypothetical protein
MTARRTGAHGPKCSGIQFRGSGSNDAKLKRSPLAKCPWFQRSHLLEGGQTFNFFAVMAERKVTDTKGEIRDQK